MLPLPTSNDSRLLALPTLPVGARLAQFSHNWSETVTDQWVRDVICHGLRISFREHPPLSSSLRWTPLPRDPLKAAALRAEVRALIEKAAVEEVPLPLSPGFSSIIFLVPKPGNRWRPVIDLSALNKFIEPPHFVMETSTKVRRSILPGDWAISIDLSDAYFHIPMHQSTRKYLRFAFEGRVYAFRALPFGLNTAPWAFTRVMDSVISVVRKQTVSQTSNYLDDILMKHSCRDQLSRDKDILQSVLFRLGFIQNLEKSDLTPSQKFQHLGLVFDTVKNLVTLPSKRIDSILQSAASLQISQSASPRQVSRLIGLGISAVDAIPLGRLHLRPLQWALKAIWDQTRQDWDSPLRLSSELHDSLLCWLDEEWLNAGTPLSLPRASVTLCSDASLQGWGAHLYPDFDTASGLWSPEESALHINVLELLAVHRADSHWVRLLRNKTVSVSTDNSTVVTYIKHQGGMHSLTLNLQVRELLLFAQANNILLQARHIPGKLNVLADSLSRKNQILPTEWSLHPTVFSKICSVFGVPQYDLFATRWNHKLPQFVSPVPDPLASAVDALSWSWPRTLLYAFPPTALVPAVLQKILLDGATVLLVCPLRPTKSWFNLYLQLLQSPPRLLPLRSDLLSQPQSGRCHAALESLNLHVGLLSAESSPTEGGTLMLWKESFMERGPPL